MVKDGDKKTRQAVGNRMVRRLYELGTPYVQLLGWIIVVFGIVFSAGSRWDRVYAYENRIVILEQFREDTIGQLASMKQKIDIMYEWQKQDRGGR